MKNILVFSICFFFSISLIAQTLSFNEQKTLLEFPDENLRLSKPIIPIDYNDDGITDLMRKLDNEILVYRGIGNDEFETLDNDLSDWNWIPLKTMDFDKDGDLDVITTRYVIINNGNGQFSEIAPSFGGVIVEAADFNNDGFVDLLTHTNEDNPIATQELILLFNQGDDTFTSEVISSGLLYGDVDLGDMDGDGDIDIVAIDYLENFPILVLTNEDGSFSSQKTNHSPSLSNSNLYLTDLDNDGDLDIVTNGAFDDIIMIENNENLFLENSTIRYNTPQIRYFKHADLNNDGFEDIVFYGGNNSNSINIYTLESKGNFDFEDRVVVGSFDRPAGFSFPNGNYTANNISLYDYNQDEKIDILHTDGYSETNQFVLIKNNTVLSSLSENTNQNQISVYPNPVTEYLRITSNDNYFITSNYKVFNYLGQVVLKGSYNGDKLINVNGLENGNYIIHFGHNSTFKFSKF